MARRLRALVVFLLLGLLVLFVLLFPQFFFSVLIEPAATMAWLFLRLFVLSIDQDVFWWGLIAAAAMVALVKLMASGAQRYGPRGPVEIPSPWDAVARWRDSILLNVHSTESSDTLRRDLAWLFTAMHSPHGGVALYEIRRELVERRIPLPPEVYEFLFAADAAAASTAVARSGGIGRLARAFRQWTDRRSGRDVATYLRTLDVVVTQMETTLEMRHEHTGSVEHHV